MSGIDSPLLEMQRFIFILILGNDYFVESNRADH